MVHNKTPILIDVDLTFVDSGWPWLSWMESVYQVVPSTALMVKDFNETGLYNYNLSKYFPTRGQEAIPPYEFWEDPHLYDKLKPLPGAVDAVRRLHEAGHPIRFVSYCKKGHFSSKVRFLKRHCPFLDLDNGTDGSGFYATKVKAGVAGGVIIDDRNQFLNQFPDDVIKIKFDTPFSQDVDPRTNYDLTSADWKEIADWLLENL
ncbi:putative 5'(3')-deoxyribonucleotidase [Pectobacterium phage vB_PatM_CB7]|nr:putative 5'(3')-deoxyribonucleotidase [Pectobacterium phage vB_PatM_CB7]